MAAALGARRRVAAGALLGGRRWRRVLVEAAASPEPLVRETVAWVLPWAGLDDQGTQALGRLRRDAVPNVAAMAACPAEVAEVA